jgi:exo-1,4-beta-D-glucosaminidase
MLLGALAVLAPASGQGEMALQENWQLQSACKVEAPGEIVSTAGFSPAGWTKTSVPSTVLAAQVANGEFKDIFFADNVRKLPGMDRSADPNPYKCRWWYRTEFRLPQDFKGRHVWLRFNGINGRANVWLNGKILAGPVAGAYRIHEWDATPFIDREGTNVLAVEVSAPGDEDFGIAFVDWNPTPPDRSMGLWRDVSLLASGPVRLRYPAVATHFPDRSLARADLTVRAELHNDTKAAVEGTLHGAFEKVVFEKKITLAPGESRSVVLTPEEFPQLRITHPELWWPVGLGAQKLHRLTMNFETDGTVSDTQSAMFGIREITGELYGPSPKPGEVFDNNDGSVRIKTDTRPFLLRVNHRPVLIRGGGWAPDMLLRSSPERLRAEFAYIRDMHLNAIRLEGKLQDDELFDLADREGILILAGWCCCDRWEHWDKWQAEDLAIATDSLRTQMLRLRSRASLALWMNGSDHHPPADIEQAYRKVLAETGWPNAVTSSATSKATPVSGATGVKMSGPYDYVPPAYWLMDKDNFGGAYGFNTETSPGAAIPELSSLKKFMPAAWPMGDVWDFHAGAGNMNKLGHFNESMTAIYGAPKGLDDYLFKAQAMAYDGERAMFEAYGRNKYDSTGVIQWMLNNGWPSVMWHLYDYYLQPAGGYFGTKKACEPLHIQYSYDDRSIVVVNNGNRSFKSLTAEAELYDFNLRRLFVRKVRLTSTADAVQRLFVIPDDTINSDVYFVRLKLSDASGRIVSRNFYWLPKKTSVFDWSLEHEREHPYYSWVTRTEDLSMLNQLKKVHIEASAVVAGGKSVRVRLRNPSNSLAFQVHLSLVDQKSGEEILPVLWDDNYISLLPGESREVVARYPSATGARRLEVNGWNIAAEAVPVEAARRASIKE